MDDLVASAISNWAPRFTTNGVAVSDFERITRGLDHWSDWCDAWCAVAAEHRLLAEEAEAEGRLRSAGQHFAQAAVYYHFAKFLFVQHPTQMRAAHTEAVRCLDGALPYLDPPGRRVEIPYDGARLVGVLRLPSTGPGAHPVVVMIPGLDSTKEEFRTTEALFLERGVGTFSVDGPGAGRGRVRPADPRRLGEARRRHHRRRHPHRGRRSAAASRCGVSASAGTTRRGSPRVTSG